MDYKISQEQISKRICMNTIVNGFVAFMRENNFPRMNSTELIFDFAEPVMRCGHEYVVSIYVTEEDMKNGMMSGCYANTYDKIMSGEPVYVMGEESNPKLFDGGGYAQSDRTFRIAVDGHLYFITGEEYRKYPLI